MRLYELDLMAPKSHFIRLPNGDYITAKYRATGSLHGSGSNDSAMFSKFEQVPDKVVKDLDLDARLDYLNKKDDGTSYKKSSELVHGHDHQGGTPFSDEDIFVYDFDSEEYKQQIPSKIQKKIVKYIQNGYK